MTLDNGHFTGVFPHVNPRWQTEWIIATCISEASPVYRHPACHTDPTPPGAPSLSSPLVWPPTEALIIEPTPPTAAKAKNAKKAAKAAARAAEQDAAMQNWADGTTGAH